MIKVVVFLAAGIGFGFCSSIQPMQDPGKEQKSRRSEVAAPVVSVSIECKKTGMLIPRDPKAPGGHVAFQLRGHEVAWRVGDSQCETLAVLRDKLRAIRERNENVTRADGTQVGQLLSIRLEVGERCTWQDVADVWSVALGELLFVQAFQVHAGTCLIPVGANGGGQGVMGGGELIVPRMDVVLPESALSNHWRPRVFVKQNGYIGLDSRGVRSPSDMNGRNSDCGAITRKLVEEAVTLHLLAKDRAKDGDTQVVNGAILVVADRWVEWSHIVNLIENLEAEKVVFKEMVFVVIDTAAGEDPEDRLVGKASK